MPRLNGYVQERQQQDQWCWAAVAVSVSRFFGRQPQRAQCGLVPLVNTHLGACCAAPSRCNETGSLREALTVTTNLEREPEGPVALSVIQEQIAAPVSRPVPIRVARSDGTAHVMAIVGFDGDGPSCQLVIDDPLFGRDRVSYGTLQRELYKGGHWSHTYFTE